jgi:hypothetical protein
VATTDDSLPVSAFIANLSKITAGVPERVEKLRSKFGDAASINSAPVNKKFNVVIRLLDERIASENRSFAVYLF